MKNSLLYVMLSLGFIFSLYLFTRKEEHRKLSIIGRMKIPDDNPLTHDKIEFGRKLFFDKRLSINNTIACASCHLPKYAFTDRKIKSEGVFGRKVERNSPTILNSGYLNKVMFDGLLESLEVQVLVPVQEHKEMGMEINQLINKLKNIPEYNQTAKLLFKREFDPFVLTRSIAAFERSLLSVNSRFDKYYFQSKNTLSEAEIRGWKLFSEKLYCMKCHSGPLFTNDKTENNGLYKDYSNQSDKGRFRLGEDSTQIGFFKIPTLRNTELTYPYMHDGSMKTMDEVINFYSKGGNQHQLQSKIIQPFHLSQSEKHDLKLFLYSLTDTAYLERFR